MRRNNRMMESENNKTKLYVLGIVSAIAVIVFIAVFVLSGNSKGSDSSQFSTAKISNLVPNNTTIDNKLEQASTQIGKSIDEAKNTVNAVNSNAINNTIKNTVKSTNTNTVSQNKNTNTIKNDKKTVTTDNKDETITKTTETAKTEEKDPIFVKPVEGDVIREYAKDKLVYSETLKEWITHSGIDIKAEKTSIVKAAANGRVSSIKNDPRYGLTVVIEHNNGYKTVYSNLLTAEFVTIGEEVESGQTIGTVGNSATFEVLDTEHLHFEILKDNENVDPNIYIQ